MVRRGASGDIDAVVAQVLHEHTRGSTDAIDGAKGLGGEEYLLSDTAPSPLLANRARRHLIRDVRREDPR